MTPVYGLFGSGEFLPWAEPVDRWMLAASSAPGAATPHRVLVVPTASAPEGDAVFDRWATMGLEHYRRLGAAPEVVALKVRGDADRPELIAQLAGASLIYFSGGNPAYLVHCLKGTAFWDAVVAAVDGGCALAGSSAGIAFLGGRTFDPARALSGGSMWMEAMRYFPAAQFGPHWDAVEGWRPGAAAMMLEAVPDGCAFVGIDEDTAILGDGRRWEVRGRGNATVRPSGGPTLVVPSGEGFSLALRPPAG
jgi:cyanophycinase-like exopeptidase